MVTTTGIKRDLIEIIESFSIGEVLDFEEKYDGQFHALKYLYSKIGVPEIFVFLVVLNALSSYQLSCIGERYWWEFSRYFSQNPPPLYRLPEAFIGFLRSSDCNRRLIEQKTRRVGRVAPVVRKRIRNIDWLVKNQRDFVSEIAKALESSLDAKTIAFSAKMLNYALRIITRRKFPAPRSIPIPVDSRIMKISKKLEISNPRAFWTDISKHCGIPPLHIDSLLWTGLRLARENIGLSLLDNKTRSLVVFLRKNILEK